MHRKDLGRRKERLVVKSRFAIYFNFDFHQQFDQTIDSNLWCLCLNEI